MLTKGFDTWRRSRNLHGLGLNGFQATMAAHSYPLEPHASKFCGFIGLLRCAVCFPARCVGNHCDTCVVGCCFHVLRRLLCLLWLMLLMSGVTEAGSIDTRQRRRTNDESRVREFDWVT